ncbi:hypothetical protein IJ384_05750 [bacterium]|nr:hypothetical protein [bacterium]
MKKFVVFFFLLAIVFCSGCKYKRGIILFNTQPITKENVLYNSRTFAIGQPVYYLFIAPKKMKNEYIRVQIFKMTDKAPWGGNEVLRTKDFRLMKDERYYHSDYFVLHEKGRYVMQVFSMDDLQRPLSIGDFYVK